MIGPSEEGLGGWYILNPLLEELTAVDNLVSLQRYLATRTNPHINIAYLIRLW